MGFDYNPYRHIELLKTKNGKWIWYCRNCNETGRENSPDVNNHACHTFSCLLSQWEYHICESHDLRPNDFEGWSDY